MADILSQGEIDSLLDIVEENTNETIKINAQYLIEDLKNLPVQGTIEDIYFKINKQLMENIIELLDVEVDKNNIKYTEFIDGLINIKEDIAESIENLNGYNVELRNHENNDDGTYYLVEIHSPIETNIYIKMSHPLQKLLANDMMGKDSNDSIPKDDIIDACHEIISCIISGYTHSFQASYKYTTIADVIKPSPHYQKYSFKMYKKDKEMGSLEFYYNN